MNTENDLHEVFVRSESGSGEGWDENGRDGKPIKEEVRLHGCFLEQLSNELNLVVDIIMSMDGRFDDIKDEMECRFQEEDYKFEVAFDELNALGKRRRIVRK